MELLVLVRDASDISSLEQLGTVEWVSKLSNVVLLTCKPDNEDKILALSNIVRVERPKIGSAMV